MILRDNSARTEHEPESRVGAAFEPSRRRSDRRKLYSQKYTRASLVHAAVAGFRRY
ncbi:hypothetical protein OCU04_009331 [Sclerotinia nivalis]|uniref:Uncharacterized protein n=1 Tax=Sclerotinia nivalis TaxID=352851 RepID=A0A9X0DH84_9HELO|nr:hypothetical protein OCU04_009331 [Sclerotinia nivalis]